MINYNDLKTNLIINNVPSDELLMKMAEQNKLEPNQIYQTPDNSSEVGFIGEGGSSVEINSTDTPVGVANFIKVNGLNYAIGEVGESSLDLLWTNPSPTAKFPAQSVTLKENTYDYYLIIYKFYYNGTSGSFPPSIAQFSRKSCTMMGLGATGGTSGDRVIVNRGVTMTSHTQFDFKDSVINSGSQTTVTTSDNYMVPLEIYGIKGFGGSNTEVNIDDVGNTQIELLWENENKYAAFESQTITTKEHNYDYFVVRVKAFKGDNWWLPYMIVKKTQNVLSCNYCNGNKYVVYRRFTINTDFTIKFNSCIITNDATTNNDYLIPMAVYGINPKFELITE